MPAFAFESQGSSPRMQGALDDCWRVSIFAWIIPADAGSTQL